MSETNAYLPVHSECMISYPYGVVNPRYSCGWHTGVDIVPHGSTENYPLLYSCTTNGTVVTVNNNPNNSLGCYVVFHDNVRNCYFRYCHMELNSIQVQVNDSLNLNSVIGRMDTTGTNITGRHLHLECSTTASWNCATFLNPCEKLGFSNIDDLVLIWSGTPRTRTTNTSNTTDCVW